MAGSDREEVTLHVLAIVERTNVAEQRRRAIAGRVDAALTDPAIAETVRLLLAARRQYQGGAPNVIEMRPR